MLPADQDSVRLLAVETCGPLARLLNKSDSVHHVLPIVQKFAQVSSTSEGSRSHEPDPCVRELHALQPTVHDRASSGSTMWLCC